MKNRRADSKHELGRKLLNTGRHSENTKRTNCPLSGGSTVFCQSTNCCCRLLASFIFSFSNSKLTKIQLCFLHTLGGSVGANVLHVPADAQSEWDVYKITLPRRGECLHNYCHSQLPAQHEKGIERWRFVEFSNTLPQSAKYKCITIMCLL